MKLLLPAFASLLWLCHGLVLAQSASPPVDFDKARQLFQKQRDGGTLTKDEEAYLERAKAEKMKQRPAQPPVPGADGIDWRKAQALFRREQSGEKLSPEEQAFLDKAKEIRRKGAGGGGRAGAPGSQRKAPATLTPLSDMNAGDRYEGEDGGLYGAGLNTPPEPLAKAAREALAQIQPLDDKGAPAADGRIVLVSISMSNATQEFSFFKRIADADTRKSAKLTIVDCAQGGQAMAEWAPADGRPWEEAMSRIERAGVNPAQVQAAWVKLANKGPAGSKPEHLAKLEADTVKVLQNAKARFPNLRIAYLGSRIWAGNSSGGLNPEPYAYESAFAVRSLIKRQMAGDPQLAPAKSPLLLWGPYLWAQGEKGRKLDDLRWIPEDFAKDGVHPSETGREKVARLLLEFFAKDPMAKAWFTGASE
jgi:hypothetical protein